MEKQIKKELKKLKAQLNPYKDTLVIDDIYHHLAVLINVIYDKEDDEFYWEYINEKGNYFVSCVFKWIPLRGTLKTKDYNRLVKMWNFNNKYQALLDE